MEHDLPPEIGDHFVGGGGDVLGRRRLRARSDDGKRQQHGNQNAQYGRQADLHAGTP
jgi:hypothetical protein